MKRTLNYFVKRALLYLGMELRFVQNFKGEVT